MLARTFLSSGPAHNDRLPLYGDKLWPWLRCFIAIWFGILFHYGLSIWFEALSSGMFTNAYAYGLGRFWVFYIPVFGFFLQKFYCEYTGDGVWTPGISYVLYTRTFFKDLFS